jgi:hypothetical protein
VARKVRGATVRILLSPYYFIRILENMSFNASMYLEKGWQSIVERRCFMTRFYASLLLKLQLDADYKLRSQ